jgi:hypothetical protein
MDTNTLDPPGYAQRVRELENQGLTTSDAQGVADADAMLGRLFLRFEVGKTYETRSICDHDCIIQLTITARTAKTVTGVDRFGGVKTFRPYISDHYKAEIVRPWGSYSMSPIMSATDAVQS